MSVDPDLYLQVPSGFDDSDEDAQVHPIARLLFHAQTPAEAFDQARQWLEGRTVTVVDVSWHHLVGEERPYELNLYFVFDEDLEDDPTGS